MSLAAGTRIGCYEVVTAIGAGGMGEVYRARDTRLKRDVALKILPDSVAADPERLARFQREAEVLGALNHPLIAHIYGIEEAPAPAGSAPGISRAIVMELVEGDDLAERLAHGAIPVDEALPIARQIAEALDAAHEQGIIHRDLKPANIKVRPDGTVKVLDFGLAKALDAPAGSAAGASAGLLNSPTITTPAMTLQGMILGTAAYMSPEQAKGRPADRRSDLWAFGCVLYEMLTGTRAFDGEDVSDTLALVLKGEPDWSALPESVPAGVRTFVKGCLVRDRRQRVSSAATALYALNDQVLAAESSQRTGAPDAKAVGAAVETGMTSERRRLMRRVVMPLAIVAGVACVVAGYALWPRPGGEAAMASRLAMAVPGGEGVPSGRRVVAISSDGRHIAYVSNLRMFVRSLSEFDFRELLSNNGALGMNMPVFSPDSGSLGFFGTGFIRRVSLAGGAATTVCAVDPPFGMSWDETGLVIGQGSNGIVRCPANGGQPERLVTANAGEELQGPQLLPGGKTILSTVAKTSEGRGRWDTAQIVVQPLIGGDRRVIVNGGSDARYLPTGHIVYALSGVMLASPFDLRRLETTGPAAPVIEGVTRTLTGVTGTAQYDVASNGTLVYLPGPARMTRDRAITVVTREGTPIRYNIPVGPYEQVRASPDGTKLAIGSDDGQEAIVWIYSLERGGALQRLTIIGRNAFPIWSPDGQWLAVQSNREKDQAIYRMRIDGTGTERLTKPGAGESHTPESWSPDGRTIAFSIEKDGRYVLSQLAVDTRAVTPLGGVESAEPTNSVFSPDGKWIAYTIGMPGAARGPNRGVYVQPFPPTGAIYQLPQRGLDFHPVWTRDGTEIVWVPSAAVAQHAVVSVSTKGGLTFGSPTAFPARVTGRQTSGQRRLYDILPDGRLVGAIDPSDPLSATGAMYSEIRVVLNWFEELRQKAPTR